ncbi:hypothetical protein DF19_20995 [Streptomyces olindensis]|nr:hypothetical protein DF19_20995 [Streptomyces olindensis]
MVPAGLWGLLAGSALLLGAALGTLVGAIAYTAGNLWPARRGARHRKRSGHRSSKSQPESACSTAGRSAW